MLRGLRELSANNGSTGSGGGSNDFLTSGSLVGCGSGRQSVERLRWLYANHSQYPGSSHDHQDQHHHLDHHHHHHHPHKHHHHYHQHTGSENGQASLSTHAANDCSHHLQQAKEMAVPYNGSGVLFKLPFPVGRGRAKKQGDQKTNETRQTQSRMKPDGALPNVKRGVKEVFAAEKENAVRDGARMLSFPVGRGDHVQGNGGRQRVKEVQQFGAKRHNGCVPNEEISIRKQDTSSIAVADSAKHTDFGLSNGEQFEGETDARVPAIEEDELESNRVQYSCVPDDCGDLASEAKSECRSSAEAGLRNLHESMAGDGCSRAPLRDTPEKNGPTGVTGEELPGEPNSDLLDEKVAGASEVCREEREARGHCVKVKGWEEWTGLGENEFELDCCGAPFERKGGLTVWGEEAKMIELQARLDIPAQLLQFRRESSLAASCGNGAKTGAGACAAPMDSGGGTGECMLRMFVNRNTSLAGVAEDNNTGEDALLMECEQGSAREHGVGSDAASTFGDAVDPVVGLGSHLKDLLPSNHPPPWLASDLTTGCGHVGPPCTRGVDVIRSTDGENAVLPTIELSMNDDVKSGAQEEDGIGDCKVGAGSGAVCSSWMGGCQTGGVAVTESHGRANTCSDGKNREYQERGLRNARYVSSCQQKAGQSRDFESRNLSLLSSFVGQQGGGGGEALVEVENELSCDVLVEGETGGKAERAASVHPPVPPPCASDHGTDRVNQTSQKSQQVHKRFVYSLPSSSPSCVQMESEGLRPAKLVEEGNSACTMAGADNSLHTVGSIPSEDMGEGKVLTCTVVEHGRQDDELCRDDMGRGRSSRKGRSHRSSGKRLHESRMLNESNRGLSQVKMPVIRVWTDWDESSLDEMAIMLLCRGRTKGKSSRHRRVGDSGGTRVRGVRSVRNTGQGVVSNSDRSQSATDESGSQNGGDMESAQWTGDSTENKCKKNYSDGGPSSEARQRMKVCLRIATSQLLSLRRWSAARTVKREEASRWIGWLLKTMRDATERPKGLQQLLFTVLIVMLPQVCRSLELELQATWSRKAYVDNDHDDHHGHNYGEDEDPEHSTSRLVKTVDMILRSLDKSRSVFTSLQWELLSERIGACRRFAHQLPFSKGESLSDSSELFLRSSDFASAEGSTGFGFLEAQGQLHNEQKTCGRDWERSAQEEVNMEMFFSSGVSTLVERALADKVVFLGSEKIGRTVPVDGHTSSRGKVADERDGEGGKGGEGCREGGGGAVYQICPINRRKIKVPARGIHCRHESCFDLKNYLQLQADCFNLRTPKGETWKCPICRRDLSWDNLIVDGDLRSLIDSSTRGDRDEISDDDHCHGRMQRALDVQGHHAESGFCDGGIGECPSSSAPPGGNCRANECVVTKPLEVASLRQDKANSVDEELWRENGTSEGGWKGVKSVDLHPLGNWGIWSSFGKSGVGDGDEFAGGVSSQVPISNQASRVLSGTSTAAISHLSYSSSTWTKWWQQHTMTKSIGVRRLVQGYSSVRGRGGNVRGAKAIRVGNERLGFDARWIQKPKSVRAREKRSEGAAGRCGLERTAFAVSEGKLGPLSPERSSSGGAGGDVKRGKKPRARCDEGVARCRGPSTGKKVRSSDDPALDERVRELEQSLAYHRYPISGSQTSGQGGIDERKCERAADAKVDGVDKLSRSLEDVLASCVESARAKGSSAASDIWIMDFMVKRNRPAASQSRGSAEKSASSSKERGSSGGGGACGSMGGGSAKAGNDRTAKGGAGTGKAPNTQKGESRSELHSSEVFRPTGGNGRISNGTTQIYTVAGSPKESEGSGCRTQRKMRRKQIARKP